MIQDGPHFKACFEGKQYARYSKHKEVVVNRIDGEELKQSEAQPGDMVTLDADTKTRWVRSSEEFTRHTKGSSGCSITNPKDKYFETSGFLEYPKHKNILARLIDQKFHEQLLEHFPDGQLPMERGSSCDLMVGHYLVSDAPDFKNHYTMAPSSFQRYNATEQAPV